MGAGGAVGVGSGAGGLTSGGGAEAVGCTTGTEREVVVGSEGLLEGAAERLRQMEPEMVLKKPFLAKLRRGPTQTLPIGRVLRRQRRRTMTTAIRAQGLSSAV